MLSLTVAQRYSVLVTARNDTSSNWAIHANMDIDMFDDLPDSLNPSMYFLCFPNFVTHLNVITRRRDFDNHVQLVRFDD